MIRQMITDLDGTLLNGSFEWDERIETGVKEVLERGGEFAAATGRTIDGVKSCGNLWNLPVYLILMNGALILDKERNVIFSREVSRETKDFMLERCSARNLEFITKDGNLTRLSRETYIREYSAWDMWRRKVLEKKHTGYYDHYLSLFSFSCTDEEIRQAAVLKINGLQLDDEKYKRLLRELDEELVDAVNAPFADHVIELTARGVSKAEALLWLSGRLGWKKEETAVFGDGGNDIEMLELFPNSFAPANASEEARRAASQVVSSCEEYGVVEKMRELAGR